MGNIVRGICGMRSKTPEAISSRGGTVTLAHGSGVSVHVVPSSAFTPLGGAQVKLSTPWRPAGESTRGSGLTFSNRSCLHHCHWLPAVPSPGNCTHNTQPSGIIFQGGQWLPTMLRVEKREDSLKESASPVAERSGPVNFIVIQDCFPL